MVRYGLTINEVESFNMEDIYFGQNLLTIVTNKGGGYIELSTDDKKILYK